MKIDDFYAKRPHPRRRPHGARHVPDAGEDAGRIEEPWDYYKSSPSIPGDQAFTTKAESKCALWK